MLFSCKITNSVLTYLEEQGEDISPLIESSSLPEDFLRDPSYWIESKELEAWLEKSCGLFQKNTSESILVKIGHSTPELRSWGVLDSVLRMHSSPKDILNQPQRFLSYFVSPAPPVDNIRRGESTIEFDVPIASDLYPNTALLLASAFESLPKFVGQNMATCTWEGLHIRQDWNIAQSSIFSNVDPGRQISPELMSSIISSLEKHQRDLEDKNQELQRKNESLLAAAKSSEADNSSYARFSEMASVGSTKLNFVEPHCVHVLDQNMSRLSDYMVRAQQLITLLVAQDRLSPQVKAAMKKVDWERVAAQFPKLVQESKELLQSCRHDEKEKYNQGDHAHV